MDDCAAATLRAWTAHGLPRLPSVPRGSAHRDVVRLTPPSEDGGHLWFFLPFLVFCFRKTMEL